MKKDVYISIKGSQDYGEDKDAMELTTAGKFYDKDGKYYLSYAEGDLSGMEKCNTTLKISPDGIVTMMRHGQTNTHMIFEKGKCHIGHYETPYGDFTISVTAKDISVSTVSPEFITSLWIQEYISFPSKSQTDTFVPIISPKPLFV